MSTAIKETTTYRGFEIGIDDDTGQVYVSKRISDKRYKIREVETFDSAYEYIDLLTVNSEE